MTDRELLKLAAKAAGYKVRWHDRWECFVHAEPHFIDNPPTMAGQRRVWLPLEDDGDALRLANALKLSICHTLCEAPTAHGTAMVGYAPWENGAPICSERYDGIGGRDAATRRAIVRAAAEIGRVKT